MFRGQRFAIYVFAFLLAAFSAHLAGLQSTPGSAAAADSDFEVDEIIAVLEANPPLMLEVRQSVAAKAERQGLKLPPTSTTDSDILQYIRTNQEFRSAVGRELVERGYLQADGEEAATAETLQAKQSAKSMPEPRTRSLPESKTPQPAPKRDRPSVVNQRSPYPHIPSMRDLYRQVPAEPGELERFGEAFFRNGGSDRVPGDLPVGPEYVLGPGDTVTISVWGAPLQPLTRTVDREGRIALPDSGVVVLSGRTLADARQLIQTTMSETFRGINVDVSLGRVRTLRVYVVGDVANPGAYDISSLSTVLTALHAAGGPTSNGSIRTVRHYRGGQLVGEIDLYDLILRGVRADPGRLQSGDSILVPPVGKQISVNGMVRRPAMYELRNETTLAQVLDLAGGILSSGMLRNIRVERVEAHEKRVMLSLSGGDEHSVRESLASFRVEDADQVTVSPILPYSEKSVYVDGHVFRPGKMAYREGMRVTDVIRSFDDLLPEPARRAEIIRLQPPEYRPSVIEFDLHAVLAGKEAVALRPFDTVRVLSRYDGDPPRVGIFGEVMRPGQYLLPEGMTASELVRMAGGLKRSAQRDQADLSSYRLEGKDAVVLDHRMVPLDAVGESDVRLKPGDTLTVRRLAGWSDIGASVTVSGEVQHPGTFGIRDGERLSSLLRRAGGFRPGAYPPGAVLERVQVRELAEKARQELIRQVEQEGAATKVDSRGTAEEQMALLNSLRDQQQRVLAELKTQAPSSRLVIQISKDIDSWANSPADIEVRAGDKLVIPKRPEFVVIAGHVYNRSAISYVPGKKAAWYLQRAGGATKLADAKATFIVRANGEVERQDKGALQPGDMIVVPGKPLGGSSIWKELIQAAQMSTSLAIAARVATSF